MSLPTDLRSDGPCGDRLGGEQPHNTNNTMSKHNEFLTSRVGKRITAFLPFDGFNAMLTGVLFKTERGWEVGDNPLNSIGFCEEMIEDQKGNMIFLRYFTRA